MPGSTERAGVPVTNYDELWGAEPRWYSLGGDVSLGRRGVPQLVVFYALAAMAAAVAMHSLPPLSWVLRPIPWWAFGPTVVGLGAASALPRVSGVRAHVFVPAALRHVLGPKDFCAWRPCAPVGAGWQPDELVLIPDGSEGRYRTATHTGPGRVARCRPSRRTRSGRGETLELVGRGRLVEPKIFDVARGRTLVVRPGVTEELR